MTNEPLRYAECCGNCVHCNRPKTPRDHSPHYETAKTQRWCYHHKFRTTREAVCDDFEMEQKKGGIPAIKRILAFHRRAERIKNIANRLKDSEIETTFSRTVYAKDGWLYYKYQGHESIMYSFHDDDAYNDDVLTYLEKELDEYESICD